MKVTGLSRTITTGLVLGFESSIVHHKMKNTTRPRGVFHFPLPSLEGSSRVFAGEGCGKVSIHCGSSMR